MALDPAVAAIPQWAKDMADPGYIQAITAALPFGVAGPLAPPKTFTSIAPPTAASGGSDLLVTLFGSGFTDTDIVTVNGADIETLFMLETNLSILIPAATVAAPGAVTIGIKGTSLTQTLTLT
jgi:hypothetical protein